MRLLAHVLSDAVPAESSHGPLMRLEIVRVKVNVRRYSLPHELVEVALGHAGYDGRADLSGSGSRAAATTVLPRAPCPRCSRLLAVFISFRLPDMVRSPGPPVASKMRQ